MSTTFTSGLGLGQPATNDTGWGTVLNTNFSMLEASALGGLAVSLHENPSTSLAIAVKAGSYRKADGTIGTHAGSSSTTVAASSTTSVYLTDAGTLTQSTSGFPATLKHVRLAVVVSGSTTITSVTDSRVWGSSLGTGSPVMTSSTTTTTTFTVDATKGINLSNCTTGAVTATLPAASSVPAGTAVIVSDISGTASTNAIAVTRAGSDTINGTTSVSISTNYGGIRIYCDGTSKWFVIP